MKVQYFFLIPGLLLISVLHTLGCTCVPPPRDLKTHRAIAQWQIDKGAPEIFEGTVERVELSNWPLKPEPGETIPDDTKIFVTFSSVRVYRGQPQKQFTIQAGLAGGDCSYRRFLIGRSYLVFAQTDNSSHLTAIGCDGTSPLEFAGTALRILKGEPPTPEDLVDRSHKEHPSSEPEIQHEICNNITFPKGVKTESSISFYYWRAEQGTNPIPISSALTESADTFCNKWLEPGTYFIKATAEEGNDWYAAYYPGVRDRTQAKPVVVTENDVSVHADFPLLLRTFHILQGQLHGFDKNNEKLRVGLFRDDDPFQTIRPVEVDLRGFFKFQNVPPGTYTLFAFVSNYHDHTMTCLSNVVNIDIESDMKNLGLQFIPKR